MEVSPYSFYCVSKNACPTALSGPECEDYQVECQNFELFETWTATGRRIILILGHFDTNVSITRSHYM